MNEGPLNLTEEQKAHVEDVAHDIPFLSFNHTTGTFDVCDAVSDPTWGQVRLLYRAVQRLRFNPPPPPPFHTIRLDQLTTEYFDRCLERYCYERLNLNLPHKQTCWVRFAEKTYCLGKVAPDTDFTDEAKIRFMESLGRGERRDSFIFMSIYRAYRRDPEIRHALKKDAEGWLMFHRGDIPILPLDRWGRIKVFLKNLLKRISGYQGNDRSLKLIRSIETHGWDSNLARKPSGVLGFSRKTRRYFVITGKHRIAALKYLHSQGRISGGTLIEYPVITYPWGSWMRGRPYPGHPVCEWCE